MKCPNCNFEMVSYRLLQDREVETTIFAYLGRDSPIYHCVNCNCNKYYKFNDRARKLNELLMEDYVRSVIDMMETLLSFDLTENNIKELQDLILKQLIIKKMENEKIEKRKY